MSETPNIQTRYGTFARQAADGQALDVNADGFAPKFEVTGDRLAEKLYSAEELACIPSGASEASIGCGNPVAIGGLKLGEYVLDLGSGAGTDCFLAAAAVGESGFVIGVDVTPEMITLAKRNQAQVGAENIEFRLGQIEAPPVERASIDLVISNCVIDISPDKTAVFNEAMRVLKPGGRIAISDTVIVGSIPEPLKSRIDTWAGAVITPLISLDAFLEYMKVAGFINLELESLTSYGLDQFDQLDTASQALLSDGEAWQPLPEGVGLYSARIFARKPDSSQLA
jgi:SAM-dependent methyltransferase